MSIVQAVILGIVQGVTEFIPVSSSAHLILVPWLLEWNAETANSLTFDVALHLGTLLAVLTYFASDWLRLIRGWVSGLLRRRPLSDPESRLAWLLIVGCIPGAVIGALAESSIEAVFHSPGAPIGTPALVVLALILALVGLLMLLADRQSAHFRTIDQLALRDVMLIGLAQAAAVFPGVSRSGSTITAGLALGLRRESAARFSFLLSAPIIGGAGLMSMVDILQGVGQGRWSANELPMFLAGTAAAAGSGLFCIEFFLGYLQNHSLKWCVGYRWAVAAITLIVALLRAR